MLRTLLLLSLAASAMAQWGEWKEVNSICPDTCGMCASRVVAERTCVTAPCSGDSQRTEVCGVRLCSFPRKACCVGYIKGLVTHVDGTLALECVPVETKK